MMSRPVKMVIAALGLLVIAGCGTAAPPLDPATAELGVNELRGTVQLVDVRERFILLGDVTAPAPAIVDAEIRVYYEGRTPVVYQGRTYTVANLEPGDQVTVRYEQVGDRLVARSMIVTGEVAAAATVRRGTHAPDVRGTVSSIETEAGSLVVDRGSWGEPLTLRFDANTVVERNGERHRIDALRVGDRVDISVRQAAEDRLQAVWIIVVEAASG